MDIRSIVTSAPAALPRIDERDEHQVDYRGTLPDSLLVVLGDGRIVCIGARDGYGPDQVWVIGPDGEDLASMVLPEPLSELPFDPTVSESLAIYQAEGR